MRRLDLKISEGRTFVDTIVQVSDSVMLTVSAYQFGMFQVLVDGPTEHITYDAVESLRLGAPEGAEDCTGLRAQLDAAERRQEELESQLSIEQEKYAVASGKLDGALTDLAGAMNMLERGRSLFHDLYQRHWVDGDDHDRQLRDMCEWAQIKDGDEGL